MGHTILAAITIAVAVVASIIFCNLNTPVITEDYRFMVKDGRLYEYIADESAIRGMYILKDGTTVILGNRSKFKHKVKYVIIKKGEFDVQEKISKESELYGK